jgi:hypothetical protein
MRKNFVKMVASAAPGTGTVSCSSVSGFPTFDTAFSASSNTRMVDYTIEDSVAVQMEWGMGSYTNGVLTRSKVKGTFTGGTLLEIAPTAINFAGTAANITVRISPLADSFLPGFPAANISSTPASNVYNSAGLLSGHIFQRSIPGVAITASAVEYYFPFLWQGQGDITQFAVYLGTAQAGGAGKFALYDVGSDGLPGNFIVSFGTLTLSSGSGTIITQAAANWGGFTTGLPLPCGWYYIGCIFTATTTYPSLAVSPQGTCLATPAGFTSHYYGFTTALKFTSGNYATGMPTGVPGRAYAFTGSDFNKVPLLYLKPRY